MFSFGWLAARLFFFVTLPLGYFQCDKYNHLLLKDEIWFLLFHSPRQTIFPGRLKSEIKSLTKTTTDLLLLSLGRIETKVAVSPIKLGPLGFRLLKKILSNGLGLQRRNFFKWVRLNVVFNLLNILCHTILIFLHRQEKRKNVCDFSSPLSSPPLYHNAKGWKGKKERRAFHWILWGIVLMHTWWARWVVKSRLIEWGKHSLSSSSS